MKQMDVAGAEYAGKRKQTRRELFLIETDRVVPWKFDRFDRANYPKGDGGRPTYPLMAMLRVPPLDQASVRLCEDALPWLGPKYRATGDTVCAVELWMARRHLLASGEEVRL